MTELERESLMSWLGRWLPIRTRPLYVCLQYVPVIQTRNLYDRFGSILTDPHPAAERPRTVLSGSLRENPVRPGWVGSGLLVIDYISRD